MDCSTYQKLFSMEKYNPIKLYRNKCVIFGCTANETKLTDIFKINEQNRLIRDWKRLHYTFQKTKIVHSNSSETQFKTGGQTFIDYLKLSLYQKRNQTSSYIKVFQKFYYKLEVHGLNYRFLKFVCHLLSEFEQHVYMNNGCIALSKQ